MRNSVGGSVIDLFVVWHMISRMASLRRCIEMSLDYFDDGRDLGYTSVKVECSRDV